MMIFRNWARIMMKVDMSAQAITLRLKRVSQLRELCLSLGKAKKLAPQNDKVTIAVSQAATASK